MMSELKKKKSVSTKDQEYIARVKENIESLRQIISHDETDIAGLPSWVQTIRKKLNATIFGKIPDKLDSGIQDPYHIGLALGFTKLGLQLFDRQFDRMTEKEGNIEIPKELQKEIDKIGIKFAESICPQGDLEKFEIYSSGYLITAYHSWDLPKSRQFFSGIAAALSQQNDEDGSLKGARMNTEILLHMFFHWDVIERDIKTVPQLHKWLQRFFPEQVVGDIKRTEKICQRIKLKIRAPGRPKTKPKKTVRKKIPTKRK